MTYSVLMCPCLTCNGTGRYIDRSEFNFQKFCYKCDGVGVISTPLSSDQERRYTEAIQRGMTTLQATRFVKGSQ